MNPRHLNLECRSRASRTALALVVLTLAADATPDATQTAAPGVGAVLAVEQTEWDGR